MTPARPRAIGQVWVDPINPARTFTLSHAPLVDGRQPYINEHKAHGWLFPEDFERLAFSPTETLLSLVDRLAALPPSAVATPDRLTMAHAPTVLRRLAPRLNSEDPAVVAEAVRHIRSMRWSSPAAPGALLWAEAVRAVEGLVPAVGAGPERPADPMVSVRAALEDAYRRGRVDGAAEERARVNERPWFGEPAGERIYHEDGRILFDVIEATQEEVAAIAPRVKNRHESLSGADVGIQGTEKTSSLDRIRAAYEEGERLAAARTEAEKDADRRMNPVPWYRGRA